MTNTQTRQIDLGHGHIAIIDEADWDLIKPLKWRHLHAGRNKSANARGKIYATASVKVDGKWVTVYMHRFILGVTGRTNKVDHIDTDGLNNRRGNLRRATNTENLAGGRPSNRPGQTSRFKGVRLDKGQWLATLSTGGVSYLSERFDVEEDAARAYDLAAARVHGEFAGTNASFGLFDAPPAQIIPFPARPTITPLTSLAA